MFHEPAMSCDLVKTESLAVGRCAAGGAGCERATRECIPDFSDIIVGKYPETVRIGVDGGHTW